MEKRIFRILASAVLLSLNFGRFSEAGVKERCGLNSKNCEAKQMSETEELKRLKIFVEKKGWPIEVLQKDKLTASAGQSLELLEYAPKRYILVEREPSATYARHYDIDNDGKLDFTARYHFSGLVIKNGAVRKIEDPKKFVFEPLHVCIDLNLDGVYSLENEVFNIDEYEKLIHDCLAGYFGKHKKHDYKGCSGEDTVRDIEKLKNKDRH